jgi:hypothetical protein
VEKYPNTFVLSKVAGAIFCFSRFFKEPKKVVIEDIDETFDKWFEGLFAGK